MIHDDWPPLFLYNTLTRKKEPLRLIEPGCIGLYVCGMTVDNNCHMGHARTFIVFDTWIRYVRAIGYQVLYVRNITDIDDKIIQRAQKNGEDYQTLAQRFITAMHEDERALGVLPPSVEPRATDYISHMMSMIEALLERGLAYRIEGGDVYYAVSKFPGYGVLAGQKLSDLQAGARVSVSEHKSNPLDFVLWKLAKVGEPSWDSPWGKGRPGWHIECSAMSTDLLGQSFDIHGGGRDLQFPHHQNEIAQSQGVHGQLPARVWMHVGHVQVNAEKMSKSLGNFSTIRQVLEHFHPEVIRYFLLAGHYRKPIDYKNENLHQARSALTRLYVTLRQLDPLALQVQTLSSVRSHSDVQAFCRAMSDDMNTSQAFSVLFDLAHRIHIQLDAQGGVPSETLRPLGELLLTLGQTLGLLFQSPETFLQNCPQNTLSSKVVRSIELLITQRDRAREDKDWEQADRVRKQLQDMGVVLEDTQQGTQWRYTPHISSNSCRES